MSLLASRFKKQKQEVALIPTVKDELLEGSGYCLGLGATWPDGAHGLYYERRKLEGNSVYAKNDQEYALPAGKTRHTDGSWDSLTWSTQRGGETKGKYSAT